MDRTEATLQIHVRELTRLQDTEMEDFLVAADPQDVRLKETYQTIVALKFTKGIQAHVIIHENDHDRETTNNHAQSMNTQADPLADNQHPATHRAI